ncbi:MAG: hypothetical protein E6H69_06800 [Betaproteobacteria bacterium]|nr:MAG: hypothetical protein E6H69_06800 [Betaproteobacteria bacterium]
MQPLPRPARTDESARTQRPRTSAGNLFACTVKADGTVNCWGDNSRGQLGFGSTALQSLTPVRVSDSGGVDTVSVSAGFRHACCTRPAEPSPIDHNDLIRGSQ